MKRKPNKEKSAKRSARLRAGILYGATGLFVFMAARIIVMIDPHFKAWPPAAGYVASFGVAIAVVVLEIVRTRLKKKRADQEK